MADISLGLAFFLFFSLLSFLASYSGQGQQHGEFQKESTLLHKA